MRKELCIPSCCGGADTDLFQSQGRVFFLLRHCINIHPSFCNSLSGQEPCCRRFGWGFFLILWGSYFGFTWMRTLLGGFSAADQCKSSKVQLIYLPFKRDDQSSWWGTWGAGSAPDRGGNEWAQTEAPENFLFFLQSVQKVGQNGVHFVYWDQKRKENP